MKYKFHKRIFALMMVLLMSVSIVIQASAAEISDYYVEAENGLPGIASRSYKAMYDYNTSSISGVMLTNAVYNYDTYAFTIARADRNGTPSVTTFQLLARIRCKYPSGSNPTNVSDDQANNITRTLTNSGIYLNSGSANYRTPISDLESLEADNYFNAVPFDSEFFEGSDFYIS